jgi:hypothetical protein
MGERGLDRRANAAQKTGGGGVGGVFRRNFLVSDSFLTRCDGFTVLHLRRFATLLCVLVWTGRAAISAGLLVTPLLCADGAIFYASGGMMKKNDHLSDWL